MDQDSAQTDVNQIENQTGTSPQNNALQLSGKSIGAMIAVSIFLLLGSFVLGMQYQEQKESSPEPTASPTIISTSPTQKAAPTPTTSQTYTSCETDADCPQMSCTLGCTDGEPCPPCGFMQCIKNRCIRKYNGVDGKPVTLPWENSICGNNICEACESSDSCCNYPCTRDTITGEEYCPPPTCEGQCSQDCR